MSLLTVAQTDPDYYIISNLDSSSTEKVVNGSTVTSTSSGTITQNNSSFTGNYSYDFGSNAYALHSGIPNSGFGDDACAIEIVFKRSTKPSSNITLGSWSAGTNGSFKIEITSNGYVRGYARNSSGSTATPTGSVNLCDGKFHHIVFSYNNLTGNNSRLYVDGTLVASTTTLGNLTRAGGFCVGAEMYGNTPQNYSSATIDFAAFYDFGAKRTSTQMDTWVASHVAEFANRVVLADAATANGIVNDVVVTHDKLSVLVPADGAAYIFPLEANLSQMTGAAMVGKTFTYGTPPGGSVSTINKSVSGGTASLYATSDLYYDELTTPAFSTLHGITLETVFQYKTITNPTLLFGKVMNSGYATNLIIAKNGSDSVIQAIFRSSTNTAFVGSTTPLVDGQWYHVIATWKTPDDSGNADDTVRLYINNALNAQSGNLSFAANTFDETTIHGFGLSNQYIDYAAIYSYPYNGAYLNATKRTQHYQAVLDGIDLLTNTIQLPITAYAHASMPGGLFTKHADISATTLTASADAVNPYSIDITHGQGGPMTATAEIVMPLGYGSVNKAAPALTAFATSVNPNVTASKNATITTTALTASAQMIHSANSHDSGLNSSTLYADADIVEPIVFIAGLVRANAMIATGLALDPAITTELNAIIKPTVLTAKSKFITPPEYRLITDDMWYYKLFLQHSVVHGETGYTPGVSSAGAFLKLFDDVTSNVTGEAGNKIINNLPRRIIIDSPTNEDTSTQYVATSNEFLTADPVPLLEIGRFDDYERKSVRFRNIQFDAPQDTYKGDGPYSLEFTFKSTKADQVIAQGKTRSFYGNQNATSSIGLIDGKLFATRVTQRIDGSPRVFAHPDNKDIASSISTAYGNKAIADGQWHHIIIQYGFDGRVQFWIDGQLDIQFFADSRYGRGAQIRPYIIGSNQVNTRWQSDFETSAWSYDAAFFVDSQNITEHYTASIKYEPIHVEPATASAEIGQDSKAVGNRGRALMLYFWPTDTAQLVGDYNYLGFTSDESPDTLTTLDYFTKPPQEFEGWDVFPVDITGKWVSDLVKVEAYGAENIGQTNFIQNVTPYQDTKNAPYALVNKRRTFRDPLTDAPRYIDLINDIDLSKFDMIMFKNYPNDPKEKDSFTGSEVVDAYFNLRETKIFEDFVKSLRAAVDTGISLMVANSQLALDLKIVDRVEVVPDLDDNIGQGNYSDPYAPTQMTGDAAAAANLPTPPQYAEPLGWNDTWKNNRTRIVNTHPDITDYPALVKTQVAFWQSTDEFRWGGADRMFARYEHKNALAVGDEFVISTTGTNGNKQTKYLAAPFANVKAGKIITAFSNTIRKGLVEVENPYKNYAQSIILEPGDVLDGRQVGGKIYVNFTEEINKAQETASVELTSVYWINYAYENGAITQDARDQLLTENFVMTETPYWSLNGMHLLQQAGTEYELDTNFNKPGVQKEAVKVRKINKNGGLSFKSVGSGSVFFSSTYAWQYPMANFELPSMPTRGFRWLSNREVLEGTVIRPQAVTANAVMPGGVAVPDKIASINAPAMIANGTIVETANNSGNVIKLVLPLTANATIVKPGSTINVQPMLATVAMYLNNMAKVASEDQVVLQLIHVDPILYIREDVIK